MTTFFNVTSVILLITAGSFVMQATSRMVEVDLVSPIIDPVWNTNTMIAHDSWLGSFLHFFAGYTPSPSLFAVLVYIAFWLLIVSLYLSELKANNGKTAAKNIQPNFSTGSLGSQES